MIFIVIFTTTSYDTMQIREDERQFPRIPRSAN